MVVLAIIFFILAFTMGILVVTGTSHAEVMPGSCPGCHQSVQPPARWYGVLPDHRISCRYCGRRYKEHPNGTIVEDRDG
jgi:hypothetical protein